MRLAAVVALVFFMELSAGARPVPVPDGGNSGPLLGLALVGLVGARNLIGKRK